MIGALAATARDGDIDVISGPRGELYILDFIHRTRLVERIPA
jgi:hypothetical protein